jgi:hypothetical protein
MSYWKHAETARHCDGCQRGIEPCELYITNHDQVHYHLRCFQEHVIPIWLYLREHPTPTTLSVIRPPAHRQTWDLEISA